MKGYFIGIDSGSTMCKAVLFDGEGIVGFKNIRTGWDPKLSAEECLGVLLEESRLCRKDVCVSATGYGREAIDFADYTFTEITCHAYGALFLSPGIGGVIDIGGQDSKVIQIRGKKVIDFVMNDKCAAGTGRFLSMACDALEVRIQDIDAFADPKESITINSMCTVFAESEIVGSLAMQKDRSKIMTGVLQSIAHKIQQMSGKLDFDENNPLLMTGGLSRSKVLVDVISRMIGVNVATHEHGLFAGALGACVCAGKKRGMALA